MYSVPHLKVSVNCHHSHECDAGRAVGKHQEEVDSAHAISKHPVAPEQGIDPQRQTHQSQEVCNDQVEEEQVVGVPGLQFKEEDPQSNYVSQQSQYDVNGEDWGQDHTLQLNTDWWAAATSPTPRDWGRQVQNHGEVFILLRQHFGICVINFCQTK